MKRAGRRLLDAVPAVDRPGEHDVIDARVAHDALARRVVAVKRLDDVPRSRPAEANARAKCSPQSGLRGECLTMTALPASTAGMTTFTAVRSG